MPASQGTHNDGPRQRVAIEAVSPNVDDGRYPIKRVAGDTVLVGRLRVCRWPRFARRRRQVSSREQCTGRRVAGPRAQDNGAPWREARLSHLGNDRWEGEFSVPSVGRYVYTVEAWVDGFATWQRDLVKRVAADQDVAVDLMIGAELVQGALVRVSEADRPWLEPMHQALTNAEDRAEQIRIATSDDLAELMAQILRSAVRDPLRSRVGGRRRSPQSPLQHLVRVVPASCALDAGPARHAARLRGAAALCGGDGLRRALSAADSSRSAAVFARARTTRSTAEPDDVGSPWAIGAAEGGHKAIHPELGTLDDFRQPGGQGRGAWESRSRWTSPFSARRIIRMSPSIPIGFASGPTARFNTPRIRPRNTRTSIRSISNRTTGETCGKN